MNITPAKRKHPGWGPGVSTSSKDTGPFFHHRDETTPYLSFEQKGNSYISTENPCNSTNSTGLSVSYRSGNKTPRTNNTPRASSETVSQGFRKPTAELSLIQQRCNSVETVELPVDVRRHKAPGRRAPFSRETPCFNKETPIILATARQVGSSVQTSCNTESIRQLQNPYSECTSTTSSEYFSKKRPASAPLSDGTNKAALSTRMSVTVTRSDESGDISETDVGKLRNTTSGSYSLNDSQVYMGVLWHAGKLGVAYYDLDTTLLHVMMDIPETEDFKLVLRVLKEVNPAAVVVNTKQDERLLKVMRNHAMAMGYTENDSSDWLQFLPSIDFSAEICKRRVLSIDLPSIPEHYTYSERTLYLSSLLPFENISMVRAVGGLLRYLEKTRVGIELEEPGTKLPILDVKTFTLESQMILDDTAYSALQIFQRESHPSVYKAGTSGGGKEGLSLFAHQSTKCSRMWFQQPLKNREEIESRHAAIAYLNNPRNIEVVTCLEGAIKHVKNISKILVRMLTSQASVGDWQAVYQTVYHAANIKEICCAQLQSIHIFKKVSEKFTDDLHQITNLISKIVDFKECSLQSRFVVNPGVDEKLDKKKRLFSDLPEILTRVANEELNKLGDNITTCSVLYVPQIGYLLAIPEAPAEGGTRPTDEIDGLKFVFTSNNVLHYKSAATRELDSLLGDTRCDITDIETAIMHKLQNIVLKHTDTLLVVLDLSAELDCLLSLAACAREYNYVRPQILQENIIEIIGGRHPIQEVCCSTFVPNDVQSNISYGKIKVLTGPNACGKSVYLKQVALIVYLAQVGSFVPAEEVKLGLIDRIYTRIRSLESVSVGLSTFMIDINQMTEALRSAGTRSLCIVDEFGKGTDMIDGLSLLSASINHWVRQGEECPHVFVSTHFHSIINQHLLPRSPLIKYLTLECVHDGEELVFLYQLVEGHTTSSYACHVAAQAGLPSAIVKRGLEASQLISQCKPVQRVDTVGTEVHFSRCEAIVSKFLELDLETADMKAFLEHFVLPTIDGKL